MKNQKTKYVLVCKSPRTWIQTDVNIPDAVTIAQYNKRMNITPVPEEKPHKKYGKIRIRKTSWVRARKGTLFSPKKLNKRQVFQLAHVREGTFKTTFIY